RRAETPLVEQFRVDIADAGNRVERRARRPRLFFGLRLAAHVELPSGQSMREANVLPALADCQRELIVGHDHFHRMLVLVDYHLRDFCRRQRAADQFGLVVGPRHDVDFLAAQLLHHRLDARAFHPDARADRVDIRILRVDGNFGAAARLARALPNLDDALVNLRHFLLEQLHQKVVRGARQHDRKPLLRQVNVEDQRADAIALAIALVRNLFLLGQDGLGASEVHDHVLALEALHDSRHDFLLAILELVENLFALGVANMLDEILLGRLRRDSAHRGGVELDQYFVADFRLGIVFRARLGHVGLSRRVRDLLDNSLYLEQLDFAEFRIEPRLDIAVRPERAPRRRMHHLLDRVDNDRLVDAFFLAYLLDYPVQIDLHSASPGR